MSSVEGTVVMVTGGSKGIGAAAVRQFLLEGAKYVAILDIDGDAGISLQNELNKEFGGKAKFIKCDVTSDHELTAAYKEVIKDNGYIDIVINNAGIANESEDMYKKLVAINFTATVTSTLKAFDLMRKDQTGKGGIIINTSSITALQQDPHLPIYYGTKSAVLQFSNCIGLKENYDNTGVKVMAICYGATDTTIFDEHQLTSYDKYKSKTDFQKFVASYSRQSAESAAKCLVEMCKRGDSGSTWLSRDDAPAKDITSAVKEAFGVLSATLPSYQRLRSPITDGVRSRRPELLYHAQVDSHPGPPPAPRTNPSNPPRAHYTTLATLTINDLLILYLCSDSCLHKPPLI